MREAAAEPPVRSNRLLRNREPAEALMTIA